MKQTAFVRVTRDDHLAVLGSLERGDRGVESQVRFLLADAMAPEAMRPQNRLDFPVVVGLSSDGRWHHDDDEQQNASGHGCQLSGR